MKAFATGKLTIPNKIVMKTGEYIYVLNLSIVVSRRYPQIQHNDTIINFPNTMNILVVPWLIANCIVVLSIR
jgi:hypothetical protein